MVRKITRILSVAFILFVSLFAVDVVGEEGWFLALIMHLIPSLVLVVMTIISWKREILGGVLWILAAIIVKLTTGIDWIITAPMLVIGGLNLWVGRK